MTQERTAIVDASLWKGRSVLVTGHTGFKGGWLTAWLAQMEARVTGFALAANTDPSFFATTGLESTCKSVIGDIREAAAIGSAVLACEPEIVFHLAAQPLVRESYERPVATWDTNVMGTLHLLEAVRRCPSVRAVVVVTSDKCYENREWHWGYRETDHLGGHDPYSSSKGAAEIAAAAWRRSFFDDAGVRVITARAGNVIGGGDWSVDRLFPDAVRSFSKGESVIIRQPAATRPWQHVLEALRGYLMLAQGALQNQLPSDAYNFGPKDEDTISVGALIQQIATCWGETAQWEIQTQDDAPHEAAILKLDWSLAAAELGWKPRIPLPEAIRASIDWYRAFYDGGDTGSMQRCVAEQIESLGTR